MPLSMRGQAFVPSAGKSEPRNVGASSRSAQPSGVHSSAPSAAASKKPFLRSTATEVLLDINTLGRSVYTSPVEQGSMRPRPGPAPD
jgi:hypothetical protein